MTFISKVCDARYIKADEVEEWVWRRVETFARHPLAWVKLFLEADFDGDNVLPLLDKQIKELRQRVKSRSSKEKELYSLLVSDAVTKDYVLDAVNEVKQLKAEELKQLEGLERKRSEVSRLSSLSVRLTERWQGCHESVAQANTLEARREWLSDLQVSVVAVPGDYVVNCFMDCELTGEDWSMESEPGYKLITAYEEKMARVMAERPELFPAGKEPVLPWDQPDDDGLFAGGDWDASDLVTIERTSA